MIRFHRFRSARRDLQSDAHHSAAVSEAIAKVLSEIDREITGLNSRLAFARDRVGAILGNGSDDYLDREAADEALLMEAEQQLRHGSERLEALVRQRASYEELRCRIPIVS